MFFFKTFKRSFYDSMQFLKIHIEAESVILFLLVLVTVTDWKDEFKTLFPFIFKDFRVVH